MREVALYISLPEAPTRWAKSVPRVQGNLAHKKHPPPLDHHESLGIGLLLGSRGGGGLMIKVPL